MVNHFRRDMKNAVEKFLREQNLLPCDGIVTGLSGGADSVCLLFLLSEVTSQYGIPLHAVHVHHGIRGAGADEDAAFCEKLCERLHVSFHLYRIDVPKEAKAAGIGEEEAGRAARYRCFQKTAEEVHASAVAVAHHRDDDAETVLFRMCRGTGLRGLCGIPKVSKPFGDSEIRLIRPLLSFGREEIREELFRRGEAYRTDESNLENTYTRNYIRNEVMPALQKVNGGAAEHIAMLAKQAEQLMALLSAETEKAYAEAVRGDFVNRKALERYPEIVRKEVLLQYVKELAGAEKDFTNEHAAALDRLLLGPVSKQLYLPYRLVLNSSYDGIFPVKDTTPEQNSATNPDSFPGGEERPVSKREGGTLLAEGEYPLEDGRILTVTVRNRLPGEIPSKKKWNKWLDCDMIKAAPVLRTRQEGDFFVIGREGGRKLLREYFVSEKIPKAKRDSILIVAAGSEVLWIPGRRGTENYLVGEQTKRILIMEVH